MSKLRDYIDIVKTKDLTAEKLKKLYDNNGYIALLTGGKSFGYTKEILPEYLQQGEILAIPVGGSFNVKYHNGFYYNANNYILQTKESLDIKYLYYQLQNKKTSIEGLYQGWGCKKLKIQSLLNLEIKLPCVSKQKEIVKVLDLLTSLTKKLTTKIFDKDKQYKYYLSELFNMKSEFLQKLLEGKKVEWRTLGEVAKYEQPTQYLVKNQNYNDEFTTPVLTAGKTFILGYTDEEDGIYKASQEPVIIFDDFTTANKWVDFDFKAKSSAMKMITSIDEEKFLLRYIYYWLNTLPSELIEGDHKRQWISNFCNKQIPIPPMEVQKEVVRILDLLTSHTTELNKELTARKKQYEYYRNKLLTFGEDEAEWKALGEALIRTKGTNITANQMKQIDKQNAPLKIFAGGKTVAFVNFNDIPEKDINTKPSIIVKSRGVVEFEFYDKPFSHKNEMWSYHSNNENINIKYVYYYCKINEKYFQRIASKMQMPQIAIPDTDKFKIPIPPLSKQQEIVEVLDKFDALTNSITEGLPKEIELRQKQYEYYRNKLLLST